MKREMSDFDLQTVVGLEFLNTPGTEVAPRSDVVRKDLKNGKLSHDLLLSLPFEILLLLLSGSQSRDTAVSTASSNLTEKYA
jgi:hypothetical protein